MQKMTAGQRICAYACTTTFCRSSSGQKQQPPLVTAKSVGSLTLLELKIAALINNSYFKMEKYQRV
jgi:hypothetical protein